MKVVSWNVNSLKARLPRVLEFLELHAPDVVCLQETKTEPANFPHDELAAAGYRAADHSAGRWAGVAVLSRSSLDTRDLVVGLPFEPDPAEARWVEVEVDGVRICSTYVINGREVGSSWFADKLAFFDAAIARAAQLRATATPFVIAGDFNVTRDDRDVYSPAAFAGATHVTPDERRRFDALLEAGGLRDVFRELSEDTLYTWWDYRAGAFHKNLGLRIDYILASATLKPLEYAMERNFRKGTKPSDHAPILATLNIRG